MHIAPLIQDLAVILLVAALVTFLFHRIRQPVVLGYIVVGLIVGPHSPPFSFVTDLPSLTVWAELGLIFLMFTLGLEFSFRRLSRVGLPVILTGIFQIAVMMGLGMLAGKFLGWSQIDGFFLGGMIAISSTTIIIKALDELNLKTRRFAEFVFGILIVEDLAAILLLVFLSGMTNTEMPSVFTLLSVLAQLGLVVGSWVLVGYFIVPRFVKVVGRLGSDEMLTILSLALCLGLVSIATHFHYSAALGAFIMGSILAETKEAHRIEFLVRPLRDVFAAVFFVSIGMLVDPRLILENWQNIIWLSLVVVFGKIISLAIASFLTGQSMSRSIQIGFSMAQIGEFSFIIATLGVSLNLIQPSLYPTIVAVSVLTTFLTPYLIRFSERLAKKIRSDVEKGKFKSFERYTRSFQSSSTSPKSKTSKARNQMVRLLLSWLSCGVILTAIFQISSLVLYPQLTRVVATDEWARSLSWLTAVALTAPFVWAMCFLFQYFANATPWGQACARILGVVLTFVAIAILSIPLLSLSLQFVATVVIALLIFVLFNRQLQKSYEWFVKNFHLTFEEADRLEKRKQKMDELAPWDSHLARVKVASSSELVGKTLIALKLRERFGVNVVAIQRGSQTIVAPKRSEILLPHDEILSVGSDEELEKMEELAEGSGVQASPDLDLERYVLEPVKVNRGTKLDGRTIMDSGIREVFGGLVVGVERERKRILNPVSTFELRGGDLVWVVAERNQLARLQIDSLR